LKAISNIEKIKILASRGKEIIRSKAYVNDRIGLLLFAGDIIYLL
jgi:hypothetical protein